MLILSGISASGKSFLSRELAKTSGYSVVPSLTTRAQRNAENGSRDRTFCTKEEFERLRHHEGIFFCKEVYSNWYAFDARGIDLAKAIFQMKYYYVNEFKSTYKESIAVYVRPADAEDAIRILRRRSGVDSSELETRIDEIYRELEVVESSDFGIDHIWTNRYDDASRLEFIRFIEGLRS